MSAAMSKLVRSMRSEPNLTLAQIAVLGEIAYQLPEKAQPGKLYAVSLEQIARGLKKDRRAVSRQLNKLIASGLVLRQGYRLGLAFATEQLTETSETSAQDVTPVSHSKRDTGVTLKRDTGVTSKRDTGVTPLREREKMRAGASHASSGDGAHLPPEESLQKRVAGGAELELTEAEKLRKAWRKANVAASLDQIWRHPQTGDWRPPKEFDDAFKAYEEALATAKHVEPETKPKSKERV